MKKLFLITSVCISAAFFGQSIREVAEFHSLKVYDKISVEIVASSAPKLEISEASQGNVETESKDGELKIKMKTSESLQGETVKVKVFYTKIDALQASQGSNISGSLKTEKLSAASNEGSKIELTATVSELEAKANTGGEIHLKGNGTTQNVTVTSGGKFYGKDFHTENTQVSTNAGGIAEVYASKSANVTTRAGGRIDVYGNPADKKDKKIAGGKINYQ